MQSGFRKVAVIMFTDIAGYTLMAQEDESRALRLLEDHRALLMPLFASHKGRVVQTTGDGFLVEFPSSLDAVECAVDIQRKLASSETTSRVKVRVGIHLGDVIETEHDILGDAVNVASRIEGTAEPGGICVSEQVYQSVLNKTSYGFEAIESVVMKNVKNPVRVYRVVLRPAQEPPVEKALSRDRIAVLPFDAIGGSGRDDYFADGLTEEMITILSSIKGLRVIARTSVVAYKDSKKTAHEIGLELGVGSIIEGSVRKDGSRVRVTVQLIDVSTQESLWGARYDRDLVDIFAVQSEIAEKVAERLSVHIVKAPVRSVSPLAYDAYLQARELMHVRSPEALHKVVQLLKKVTEMEPSFASAYASLANVYVDMGLLNLAPIKIIEDAKRAAEKAIQLDPELADAHAALGMVMWVLDENESSERAARRALELNPSLASGYESLATLLCSTGNLEEAIRNQEVAYKLDPLSKRISWYLSEYYLYAGRREESVALWSKLLGQHPALGHQGFVLDGIVGDDLDSATSHLSKMGEIDPEDRYFQLFKGMVAGLRGDRAAAENVIEYVEKKFGAGAVTVDIVGFIRFCEGDLDSFFDCMLRAADTHVLWALQLRYSPLFAKVRSDPRMKEAFVRAGVTL